jgi:hypothetical protein
VEDYPFGDEAAVFKAVGRMFAIVALGPGPSSVSLKCDPGLAGWTCAAAAPVSPRLTPQQAALEHIADLWQVRMVTERCGTYANTSGERCASLGPATRSGIWRLPSG